MRTMKRDARGFTIVELLIATTVFSGVLMIVMAGVISFTRQYQKGITASNTQSVARSVLNEVSQAVQFSTYVGPVQMSGSNNQYYCIGNRSYFFQLNRQLNGSNPADKAQHVLVGNANACTSVNLTTPLSTTSTATLNSAAVNMIQPRELLGERMRLGVFNVSTVSAGDNMVQIRVRVISGESDLLCSPDPGGTKPCADTPNYQHSDLKCRGGAGSEYCAVVDLTTEVMRRLQ